MKAYLLTWNPERFEWSGIDEVITEIGSNNVSENRWSSGSNKSIKAGDLFFMLRLGPRERGLVGYGYCISDSFQDEHWEDEDKMANYVNIEFKYLINPVINPELIIRQDFLKLKFPTQHWSPQGSGTSIKEEIIPELLKMFPPSEIEEIEEEIDDEKAFIEGKRFQVLANQFERNKAARELCLNMHGYTCKVCKFNFEKVYGKIGKTYIHVHHIVPLSTRNKIYKLDPIKDLIPVCANCHAMLHTSKVPLKIDYLKKLIKSKNS